MDVIFENMEDFTNTSVLNSYNVWTQINKDENFDINNFSKNQNQLSDFLDDNLNHGKMNFKFFNK